ncbi:MAG TPA: protein kinase [Terriglobales bacterium]|nr:protein kinase [Terriglobales bacterium]
MALSSGTKLGPYEIVDTLGAGGMGEVYRARDTRLDRTVAVKVLPSHLSADPERKQRFEREARAISSLQHPHICTLHDVGSQDGVDFLVMEHLEGETLAERLKKGALPTEQVLKIGMEVADALDKAHRQGVVHRDLKPGNIMLTKSGSKLLDFGLAKPAGTTLASGTLAQALTAPSPVSPLSPTTPLTQQGTIVGTFQYMSPEQVEGKEADARTDIFALGAVLYEMATGKRAFEGKSQLSVASAILERDPEPISRVQPLAPAALEHVVKTCLAKDPEDRWQSAADVRRQLKWISEGGSQVGVPVPEAHARRMKFRLGWAIAAVASLAAVGFASAYFLLASRPAQIIHSQLPAPEKAIFDFTGDLGGPPVLSPDGKRIVFAAHTAESPKALWVRQLDSDTAQHLDGTDGAYFPFWSADSRFVGFFADGKLKKIPAGGGPVTTLADAPNARGGAWGKDDVIVYTPDFREVLYKISAAGGLPVKVTEIDSVKHTTHRWPFFLPDGKHFIYLATNHSGSSREANGIYFGSLDGKGSKQLVATEGAGQYASGYLLFQSQATLVAQPFNPSSGVLSGEPMPVAERVQYDSGIWRSLFTVSENGLLAYQGGSARLGTELVWFDRTGKQVGRVAERERYADPRLSPDGKRLAVTVGDPLANIWVFDLVRGTKTRLTFDNATHNYPSWSPDGSRIAFASFVGPFAGAGLGSSLHTKASNGTGQDELLLASEQGFGSSYPEFSPDGRYLVYQRASGPTGSSVWAVPVSGEKKPFPVAQPQSPQNAVFDQRISPDGRWLAYTSNDSGADEIYVTPFPAGGGRWQITTNGGDRVAWRGDGKELYYWGNDQMLTAVEVNPQGSEFQVGATKPLFRLSAPAVGMPYDVSSDGQRFLVNYLHEDSSTPLTLVVNWTTALKK